MIAVDLSAAVYASSIKLDSSVRPWNDCDGGSRRVDNSRGISPRRFSSAAVAFGSFLYATQSKCSIHNGLVALSRTTQMMRISPRWSLRVRACATSSSTHLDRAACSLQKSTNTLVSEEAKATSMRSSRSSPGWSVHSSSQHKSFPTWSAIPFTAALSLDEWLRKRVRMCFSKEVGALSQNSNSDATLLDELSQMPRGATALVPIEHILQTARIKRCVSKGEQQSELTPGSPRRVACGHPPTLGGGISNFVRANSQATFCYKPAAFLAYVKNDVR
jgi:hypothetical protein